MKYSISIISYLDLLGFRQIVTDATAAKEVFDILRLFRKRSTPDSELAKIYEQRFTSFSDLAVRTTNILSKTNKAGQVGILFYDLLDLIYLQCDLVAKGIFIRGAVTIGNIYHKAPFVFGQGLIKAYELESKTAIYPRVIVDPDVIAICKKTKLLKAHHHTLADEMTYIQDLMRKGQDGVLFLDYLKVISGEVDDPKEYFRFLLKHKRSIIENHRKNRGNRKVTAKYVWLARYHNEVVSEMRDKDFSASGHHKRNFKIPQRISNAT